MSSINPYTAPEVESRADLGSRQFALTHDGILCRNGATLPIICLITGATSGLVPHKIKIVNSTVLGKSLRIVCGMIIVAVLLILLLPQRLIPAHFSSAFPNAARSALWMLPVTSAIWFLSYVGARRFSVNVFVLKSRARWRAWPMIAMLLIIATAALSPLDFPGWDLLRIGTPVVAAIAGLIVQPIIERKYFHGMFLRAAPRNDSTAMLTGFSEAFIRQFQQSGYSFPQV